MVITRTPFRISFFGGGTDYPKWYKKNGGIVLSTSINKYCYITTRYLPPFFNYKYRIRYTKREETQKISEIDHPSVKECLKYLKIKNGIEMVHTSDLPAMSGLGSSSAFTVGFLHSLYALENIPVNKQQLAREAIYIEQHKIKESVGSQDQTIAAYGGLNVITFQKNDQITAQPLTISKKRIKNLENNLMLFFTGFQRHASDIAKEIIKNTSKNQSELMEITDLTKQAIKVLTSNETSLNQFGELLHRSWEVKKNLAHNITNPIINQIYNLGLEAGAIGGKLLGAGNGGFILFFVPPNKQNKVKSKLKDYLYVPFKFDNTGSQLIYRMPNDLEFLSST